MNIGRGSTSFVPHIHITRSVKQLLIQYFYEEIELTLHRLRKIRNTVVNTTSSSNSAINSNLSSANTLVASSNIFIEP
ncbi:hypothetical protein CR513_18136, partial [Mucuna pruriens]